jgi:hypothetical protein
VVAETTGAPVDRPVGRRVARLIIGGLALALIGTLIGGLIYRDRYAPIQPGGRSGVDGRGMMSVSDGLGHITWIVPGGLVNGHAYVSLLNSGSHDIRVLSVGEPDWATTPGLAIGADGVGAVGSWDCCTGLDLPIFQPFTLHAGETRTVRLALRAPACPAGDIGFSTSSIEVIDVRFRFWGHTKQSQLRLPAPFYHACPLSQVRPHLTGLSELRP